MGQPLYEKGSLRAIEMLLLVLTWMAELGLVVGPILSDQWYERAAFWPAAIGFFCATWVSRVLLTGSED